jgi:hypothetical protein
MTAKAIASKLYNTFYDVSSHPHCVKVRHEIAVKEALDFMQHSMLHCRSEVIQELNNKLKIN